MWNRKHVTAKKHIKEVIEASERNPKIHKADIMEDHVDELYEAEKPIKRSDMMKKYLNGLEPAED